MKKILLAFLGFLMACFILEIVLRLHSYLEMRRGNRIAEVKTSGEYWPIYDPDLAYRGNPKFADHNSDGLRDHPIGPKGNSLRLLFLGDSVIYYGENLDDTVIGHLRKELQKNVEYSSVDVIDAGIRGYTNYQELLYLKKYGLKFQPDLVGVQFCVNDLFKFLHSFTVQNGVIVNDSYDFSEEARNQSRGFWKNLAENSSLISWTRRKIVLFRYAMKMTAVEDFSFARALDTSRAWQDEPWVNIERQFREFSVLGKKHHFQLFVVMLPHAGQYKQNYLKLDRNFVLKPQRKMRQICERLRIPFYDLYPDMNAALFEDGIHLAKSGRQKAGQLIATYLENFDFLRHDVSNPHQ